MSEIDKIREREPTSFVMGQVEPFITMSQDERDAIFAHIKGLERVEKEARAVSNFLTGCPEVPENLLDYVKEVQARIDALEALGKC